LSSRNWRSLGAIIRSRLQRKSRLEVQNGLRGELAREEIVVEEEELPKGWKIELMSHDRVYIAASGYFRDADELHVYFVLSQRPTGGVKTQPLQRTIEQYLAAHPRVHLSEPEKRATESLALKLKPDDSVEHDKYKDEYTDKQGEFRVSERGYDLRVWPAARWLAGLPLQGKPGPKKGRKKPKT
jgi:hypothetical protein